MSQHIDAIFINGVFRPEQPVNFIDGERVSLTVDAQPLMGDDLHDVRDLLDTELMTRCRLKTVNVPSLDAVRESLGAFREEISDLILKSRGSCIA